MPDHADSCRRPIADSPWFWVYLFSIGGLIALLLMSPKFGVRQAQIEREYQGRQRAIQNKLGKDPATELSTRTRTIITLSPLFVILSVVLIAACGTLWWTHFRRNGSRNRFPHRETAS